MVDLPKDSKTIGCRWVKTRLAAKGYAQTECIDYNKIFSPIIKHMFIRMLLAIVAQFDLELKQLDVKISFLHGELEERIYMKQPERYIQERQENTSSQKSLYGLEQSPRQWYKRFDSFMIKARYTRCEYDSCVYFKQNNNPIYLSLYADDMLIAARNKTHIQKLKA